MTRVENKRIALAGKLVGKYAARGRGLEGRLAQLGASWLDGFDAKADVVVLGAKSRGFLKRIQKAGLATITNPNWRR